MNNRKSQKISPVKIALMELVMFGEYKVSDKIGVCEFIERMSDDQLENIAETLIVLDSESDQKSLLENNYNEELKKKNSSVFMSESIFAKNRDQLILQEADDSGTPDAMKILKVGGVSALGLYIIKHQAEDPAEVSRMMTNLRQTNLRAYETVAAYVRHVTNGKIDLPSMKKTNVALTNLHNAQQAMSNRYKARKPITPALKNAIDKAKDEVKTAKSLDLKGGAAGLKRAGKYSGLVILAMMGLTGLAIMLVHIYQQYLSDAAVHCKNKKGKENKICILTYKIEACEVAIRKCREALGGCKDKANPEKCIHSVQTQIWNWEKRKRKYQQKIAIMVKEEVTPPQHPSKNPLEDQPSKDGNMTGGGVFRSKA